MIIPLMCRDGSIDVTSTFYKFRIDDNNWFSHKELDSETRYVIFVSDKLLAQLDKDFPTRSAARNELLS